MSRVDFVVPGGGPGPSDIYVVSIDPPLPSLGVALSSPTSTIRICQKSAFIVCVLKSVPHF